MDFGRAFTYVFDDPDWLKKIGIAGVIALVSLVLSVVIIGIAGWIILSGWMVELVRRVINRDPTPLPDWNDFGGYFSKGLKVFVVGVVYSLPLIILNICISGVLPALAQNSNSDTMSSAVAQLLSICFGCVSFIYGIFLGLVLPAAYARVAVTDQIGAGLRFAEVIALVRAKPSAYIIALLGGIVASIIASLGIIACGIGIAFTMAYSMAINGHLYGQAYLAAGGSPSSAVMGGAQTF